MALHLPTQYVIIKYYITSFVGDMAVLVSCKNTQYVSPLKIVVFLALAHYFIV